MKVSDYITKKLGAFDIELSEADLLDIELGGLDLNEEVAKGNEVEVKKVIAGFIPLFLSRPSSINENGFSASWDIDGIKSYYSILCSQLGIDNIFASKISDASDLW